jgi:hypothetical protein
LNAALMVFARAGAPQKAIELARSLERHAETEAANAFVHAGWGLASFSDGKIENGRSAYERAIQAARAVRRYDLVVNACMFWMREETSRNLMAGDEIRSTINGIDKGIARVGHDQRVFLNSNWIRLKQAAERLLVEGDSVQHALIVPGEQRGRIEYLIGALEEPAE